MNFTDQDIKLKKGSFTRSYHDVEEEAIYHQLMMMIQLNFISTAEFTKISNGEITLDNYLDAATFQHELMHFIDHLSTLHGQKNLVLLFNAINAWANHDESEFHHIKSLFDRNKKDSFSDFYTEINQRHDASFAEPWDVEVTSGTRFDFSGYRLDYVPILFLRFFDKDRHALARTPISVAALHETNAVFAEFQLKLEFIAGIEDEHVRKDETDEVNRNIEDLLYSTDYCLYSAAAHLTAKTNEIEKFEDIYKLTSSLGTLALNLSDNHITAMKQKPFPNDEWQRRFSALTANADIGYAYYRLNENLIDSFGPNNYSIENVLAASNLPDRKKLETDIMSAMFINLSELIDGPFKAYATILVNYGVDIFIKRGLDGRKPGFDAWVKEEKPFPTILCNDTIWPTPQQDLDSCIKAFVENNLEAGLEAQFKTFAYFNEKFSLFGEACGI